VRVTAAGNTAGLFSQYLLSLDLVDTVPPTIKSDDFPSQNSVSTAVSDRGERGSPFSFLVRVPTAPTVLHEAVKCRS
jgi:hypothetical protein